MCWLNQWEDRCLQVETVESAAGLVVARAQKKKNGEEKDDSRFCVVQKGWKRWRNS